MYSLVILCVISIWLIIINFRVIKTTYYDLGRLTIDDMPDVPDEELVKVQSKKELSGLIDRYTEGWRKGQIAESQKKHKYLKIREFIFEILLATETILVLWIIFRR